MNSWFSSTRIILFSVSLFPKLSVARLASRLRWLLLSKSVTGRGDFPAKVNNQQLNWQDPDDEASFPKNCLQPNKLPPPPPLMPFSPPGAPFSPLWAPISPLLSPPRPSGPEEVDRRPKSSSKNCETQTLWFWKFLLHCIFWQVSYPEIGKWNESCLWL